MAKTLAQKAEALAITAVKFDCIFESLDLEFAELGVNWPVGIREDFQAALEELESQRDCLILEVSLTHDIQDPKQ